MSSLRAELVLSPRVIVSGATKSCRCPQSHSPLSKWQKVDELSFMQIRPAYSSREQCAYRPSSDKKPWQRAPCPLGLLSKPPQTGHGRLGLNL